MTPDERISKIEHKLGIFEQKLLALNTIEKKVDRLTTILIGNDLVNGDDGYVGKIKNCEEKIIAFEKLWDKIKFFAYGAIFFSGYGVYQLVHNIELAGIFK